MSGRDNNLALLEILVQIIIFCVALLSNGLVLIALIKQMRVKPKSRMFRLMFHLSVADLLVAVLNVLPQIVWDITHRFEGPDAVCRLVKVGQVFPLYLSSFILTLMAIDRARVVSTSPWPRPSLTLVVSMAWLLSLLFAMPQLLIFGVREIDDKGTTDCWADFGHSLNEKLYVLIFLFLVFFLPMLIITVCYSMVTYSVWKFDRRRSKSEQHIQLVNLDNRMSTDIDTSVYTMRIVNSQEELDQPNQSRRQSEHSNIRRPRAKVSIQHCLATNQSRCASGCGRGAKEGPVLLTRAKRKSLELTATVCICFAVCWLPWSIAMLCIAFGFNGVHVPSVLVILALLASLNSTTNPWIYLYFNKSVLQQVKSLLGLREEESGGHGRRGELRRQVLRQLEPDGQPQRGEEPQRLDWDPRPSNMADREGSP